MALSETLPVYRQTYDLLQRLMALTPKLPRVYRYNLGERLINSTLDMIALIYEANTSRDKSEPLSRLAQRYAMVTMLMRLIFEKKLITSQQYAPYVQLLASIGRQCTAWKNYANNKSSNGQITIQPKGDGRN